MADRAAIDNLSMVGQLAAARRERARAREAGRRRDVEPEAADAVELRQPRLNVQIE
jgi:hypothetical protein